MRINVCFCVIQLHAKKAAIHEAVEVTEQHYNGCLQSSSNNKKHKSRSPLVDPQLAMNAPLPMVGLL